MLQVKSTVAGVVGAGQDKASAAGNNAVYAKEQAKAYAASLVGSAKGITADAQGRVCF